MFVRSVSSVTLLSTLAATLAATLVACGKGGEKYPESYGSAAGTGASTAAAPASVPPSVDAVGTHGEDLYDQVKARDWKKATEHLDSLRVAIGRLPADVPAASKASLVALSDSLAADIAAKQRDKAMRDANRVTLVSAELVRPYASPVPVPVMLLDYEGRELEIWSTARDTSKLTATKQDLRRTWDEIRPEVEKRNATQAKHTEALVARIEAAKTPADLHRLASPFLDEVDALEKVFASH